jgi:hypothetical protein
MNDTQTITLQRLLKPDEVSAIIPGKTKRALAVERALRRDTPPWLKIGSRIYYDPADLQRWIEAHRVDPARPEVHK